MGVSLGVRATDITVSIWLFQFLSKQSMEDTFQGRRENGDLIMALFQGGRVMYVMITLLTIFQGGKGVYYGHTCRPQVNSGFLCQFHSQWVPG